MEFRLPQLAEGVDEAVVVQVLVNPGDTVAADQPLIAVNAQKTDFQVPAPVAGRVEQIRVKPDEVIHVGTVVAVIAPGAEQKAAPEAKPPAEPQKPQPAPEAKPPAPAEPSRPS